MVALSTLASALALPSAEPVAAGELPGLPAWVPVEVPQALLVLLSSTVGVLAFEALSAPRSRSSRRSCCSPSGFGLYFGGFVNGGRGC